MNIENIPDLSSYLVNGKLTQLGIQKFQAVVYEYYEKNKRFFPWRETRDPYNIVVSEIMLQQTQADRVVQKYLNFIESFPTVYDLAQAPLKSVLTAWIGLGYNRRAMSLQLLSQRIVDEHSGNIPNDPEVLVAFKGIGPNTAGSICAFAFNRPTIFIETNIRSVFIHLFFKDKETVSDSEIIPLIQQANDNTNAREWYYALMDYGVMLKKKFKNPSRKSKHHTKQSKFEGSDRQIRGKILKLLVENHSLTYEELQTSLHNDQRFAHILQNLLKERLVINKENYFVLP